MRRGKPHKMVKDNGDVIFGITPFVNQLKEMWDILKTLFVYVFWKLFDVTVGVKLHENNTP